MDSDTIEASFLELVLAPVLGERLIAYLLEGFGTVPPAQTTVVRIRRRGGVVVQGCDVYVGRACNMAGWRLSSHPLANPYSVGQYGREGALRRYREWLYSDPKRLAMARSLRGKVLGCWCAPAPCHADIIAQAADAP